MNKKYIFLVAMIGIILINTLIGFFIDFSTSPIYKDYIAIFLSSIIYLLGIISFMYLSFQSMRSHKKGGLWVGDLVFSIIMLTLGTLISAQDFGYGGLLTVPFVILLSLVWIIVINVISGKNKSADIKDS